jgi:hypothetical protein
VLEFILSLLAALRVFFRCRCDTALEVLALRQQVAMLKRKHPRPTLRFRDRLFWTTLRRVWPRWADVLIVVKPKTVIGWHRAGFRLYWHWRSRPRGGRPKITFEVRALVRRFANENPDWGAPKIHGELRKFGIAVPNAPWLGICGESCVAATRIGDGSPFSTITGRRLRPSTSSPCRL